MADSPATRVAQWLYGTGPAPERAEILALLERATQDPHGLLQPDWPMLRIARLNPLEHLRRDELIVPWCLVWISVISEHLQQVIDNDTDQPPTDEEVHALLARFRRLPPRIRGIVLLVAFFFERGAPFGEIVDLARLLLVSESGGPS